MPAPNSLDASGPLFSLVGLTTKQHGGEVCPRDCSTIESEIPGPCFDGIHSSDRDK